MTIAEKILTYRKQLGLSQEELAEKLQVSRQAISRWEMGTAVPDAANLFNISKLFGVTVDYLVNDDYSSDADLPVVKRTEKTVSDVYKQKVSFIVLVGLHVFAFLLQCYSFMLPRMGYVVAWLVLLFCGVAIQLGSIVAFEITAHRYEDEICRREQKRYYRVSVWLFAFFPINWGLRYLEIASGDYLGYFMGHFAFALTWFTVYLLVCGIVFFSLRDKRKNKDSEKL